MQIIQSIRKRAAIATGAIAIAIIGFMLLDARSGSDKLFGKGASNAVGEINGKNLDINDFTEKVKQAEQQYGSRAGSATYQIREQVWNQLVAENLLNGEFEKLGMSLSPKELSSILFSNDAPQSWKQYFTDNTTGAYDIAKAQQAWAQIKKSKGADRKNVEDGIINPIILQTLYSKYSSLISAGAYYPSWMQQQDAADDNAIANISYVAVPYNTINDSAVKVSDEDINEYVEKHKAQYKLDEGGRLVSYVSFSTDPSAEDTVRTLEDLVTLKPEFAADTNAKVFLARNSSAIQLDDHFIVASKITSPKKDSITSLPVNGLFGPYLDGKNFVIAKMIATRQVPDSVKCRHILIKIADNQSGQVRADSVARKLVDSIADAIKNGADFNEMVLKYSDDAGSKNTKGEYTFASSAQLVDSFYRTVFYDPNGTKKIVKGESGGQNAYVGYHYIEVLNQWNFEQGYEVAYAAKEIVSSDETINMAQSKATGLAGQARDTKAFNEYVTKNNLFKVDVPSVIKENDFQVGGLQDARQIVRWAFDAKEGEVSEPINVDDKFVVATVTKVQKAGLPDAAVARPQVEALIKNQKKADQIIAKIGKDATIEKAGSTYSIPVQIAGADSTLTFGSFFISGIGQEPKVIGAAFDKDFQGKSSAPIIGNNGVYVIKVNSLGNKATDSPETAAQKIAGKEKNIMQQYGYGWFEALKRTADVKDERSKFF